MKYAKESGYSMRIGMSALALLTLVIGVLAGKFAALFSGIAGSLDVFRSIEAPFSAGAGSFQLSDGFASVSMPLVFGVLLAVIAAIFGIVYFLTANRKTKIARTWDCGTDLNPRMEITATGFSRSIITIFDGLLRSTRQVDIEYHDAEMRYFQKTSTVRFEMKKVYSSYLYKPLRNSILKLSEYFKMIQSGNVNAYVAYIFLILVVLLLVLAI